jgi:hypothetical protein
MPNSVFVRAVERAWRYRITTMETVERIALLQMTQDVPTLPFVEVDEAYLDRAELVRFRGDLSTEVISFACGRYGQASRMRISSCAA